MTGVDSFVRTDQISQIFGPASSTVMPSEIGMHQNVPSGMGTGMPLKIGTMMPTPVMTQQAQPEILPVGRNNSAEGNISLSQQQTLATSSSTQSGFLNICEGNLSLVRWGEPEHISRLQGWCKRSSAFESVRECTGKADVLTFWAIDKHAILNYLQKRSLDLCTGYADDAQSAAASTVTAAARSMAISSTTARRTTIVSNTVAATTSPSTAAARTSVISSIAAASTTNT